MDSFLSVEDLVVQGKRVLVRVDFNVPLTREDGKIEIRDDTRIRAALPTIELLRKGGAKIILMSHLGRPKGKVVKAESLKPVATRLGELLDCTVDFADNCVGDEAKAHAQALQDGELLLLENLRFHAQEEENDPAFASELASLGEFYVNDAFGTAHRAHASTAGVAVHMKKAAAGLLMQKELQYLIGELQEPKRPFLVILGGKKVSDKIQVIEALLPKADEIIIGGAMAYTFLKALGHEVGDSLVEEDRLELALELLARAKELDTSILLPTDSLIADDFSSAANTKASGLWKEGGAIEAGWEGIDIGPESITAFTEVISRAKTILWNGPMGVFEIDAFAQGTKAVAEAVAQSDALSIIGGGDSVTAINKFELGTQVSFCSTGGGASLKLLEGKELPGVAAITKK